MPLIIDGGRVPSRWAERTPGSVIAIESRIQRRGSLRVALINNMPDPALEDTELQFFELLDSASGNLPVFIKLYSLTGVPRTDRGERHLNNFYFPFDDLWRSQFDGVVITGTEPRYSNLREEPYWTLLAEVFDWAQRNTTSTILSCLAAHASVLHCDGIKRHPLQDKKFGVFEASKKSDHALMSGGATTIRFPHSRWNEVCANDLTEAGYSILAESQDAGVDLFVKKKVASMFVHFQGHPEYGPQTLAKEYRRDIKRFLRGERETYPSMPEGYFGQEVMEVLSDFRRRAVADRREEVVNSFPDWTIKTLQNKWQSEAIGIYRNWLRYLESKKVEATTFPLVNHAGSARLQVIGGQNA